MSTQGQLLEINVVGCRNLKDTEWISKQDPYVVLEYANTRFRTKTDTDGGTKPSFNEKFILSLIEGLREINVQVWNSNSITFDDFIGSGKIQLQNVLSTGYDDNSWALATKSGKHAGEIRVIMHYANAKAVHSEPLQHAVPVATPYQVPPAIPSPYQMPSYGGYPAPLPASYGIHHSVGYPPNTYGPSPSGYTTLQPYPFGSQPAPYNAYQPPAYPSPGYEAPHPGYGSYRYPPL
eukprot:c20964_g1_i1 orf=222-926(+)